MWKFDKYISSPHVKEYLNSFSPQLSIIIPYSLPSSAREGSLLSLYGRCLDVNNLLNFLTCVAICGTFITSRKRSLGQGNMFTGVCLSTGGGVSGPGGVPGRGGLVPGGCLVETSPDGYCCGQYASYWNAFLFDF